MGAVERKKMLDPRRVRPGDVLLALPSSGLHTNGYSLARKLCFGVAKLEPDTYVAEVGNKIGAELLKPHRAYWPLLKNILAQGMGFVDGAHHRRRHHRKFAAGAAAQRAGRDRAGIVAGAADFPLSRAAWDGSSATNCCKRSILGVGMILVVPAKYVARVEAELKRRREKFYVIGRIETRGARQAARQLFGRTADLRAGIAARLAVPSACGCHRNFGAVAFAAAANCANFACS